MSNYTIEIFYRTGNSFHSHSETETIGWLFETIEEATKCLLCIREHHKLCMDLEDYEARRNGGRQGVLGKYAHKEWFDAEYPEQRFKFGDRFISTFWIGYFEQLYSAKIVYVDNNLDPLIYHGYDHKNTVI